MPRISDPGRQLARDAAVDVIRVCLFQTLDTQTENEVQGEPEALWPKNIGATDLLLSPSRFGLYCHPELGAGADEPFERGGYRSGRSPAPFGVETVKPKMKLESYRLIGTIIVLTVIYTAAGKLGLSLAFAHPSASVVWAPTGISLAMLLVLGFRVWPAVFLGAFLVNVTTAGTVATSIGIATGNTLESLVGALLVKHLARGIHTFDQPQGVLKFVGLAAVTSTTISATFGVTSLTLGGFANGSDYGSIWLTWWLGDMIGALVVAPPLVLWAETPRLRWEKAQIVELAGLAVTLVIVSQVVFGGLLHATADNYPLSFLCLPIQAWAALRFGQRETATVTLVVAGTAVWGTLQGFGPFVLATPHESLIIMQTFIGTTAVLALTFAAVVAERHRAEQERELVIQQLFDAIGELRTLRGLLPICAGCKRIRNDEGAWEIFEAYIERRSNAQFTHSMCPECFNRLCIERHP